MKNKLGCLARTYHRYLDSVGDADDCIDRIEELLIDILPQGAGLDTAWEFEWYANGNIDCHIYYHYMDSYGGYRGYTPVKVKLWRSRDGKLKYKLYCANSGYYTYSLRDSLFELFRDTFFPEFEYSDNL